MTFSALLTNYNCGRYLPDAVRSALEQKPAPREVIVVDDGSSDDSRRLIRQFGDQVRWIELPHGGQAAALNAVAPQARGEWIAFLESDDIWLPGKLAAVAEAAGGDSGLIAVQHALTQADQALRPRPTELPQKPLRMTLQNFLDGETLLTGMSGLAVKKEALLALLPLPAQLLTCVDVYLHYRLLAQGPMLHIPGSCGLRRWHGANNYAGIRGDPARLAAFLSLCDANDRLLESFLRAQGLSLSPEHDRLRRRERLEFELLRWRLEGRWGKAGAAWLEAYRCCATAGYAFFKGASLAVALLSPRLYLRCQAFYEQRRLGRLRRRLLP